VPTWADDPSTWRRPQRGQSLAEYVGDARRGRRVPLDALVRQTGLSTSTLRKIEDGRTKNPGVFTVLSIWRALRLPVDAFEHLQPPD